MALPNQFKTAIDSLYDQVQASETGVVYTKVTINGKLYKIRVYKGNEDSGYKYRIDILSREE